MAETTHPAVVREQVLESLSTKVRVALLYGNLPAIALSGDTNRWPRTVRYKPIEPAECRELARILSLCADEAERNVAENRAAPGSEVPR